jgi:hypothetical protein
VGNWKFRTEGAVPCHHQDPQRQQGVRLACRLQLIIKLLSVYYLVRFCTDTISSLFVDSMIKEYFNFLNKYLATFKGSDDDSATIGDAMEEAVAAIVEFVKSSTLFQVLHYPSACLCNYQFYEKRFREYSA